MSIFEAVAYKLYRHNVEANGVDQATVDAVWCEDPGVRAFWITQVELVGQFITEAMAS